MQQHSKITNRPTNLHLWFVPCHSNVVALRQGGSQMTSTHPDYIEDKSKGYRIAGQQQPKGQSNARKCNSVMTHENSIQVVIRSECKVQEF